MRTGTRISGRRAITLQSAFVAALLGVAPLGASSAAETDGGTVALDVATSSAVIEIVPLEPSTEVTAPDVAEPALLDAPSAPQETLLGRGSASYYAAKFHGRRTASGETFNNREMTAAHRTLPFGTRVRVTNPSSGASVVVRINDRGPFTRGRMIDVSRAAAEQLGLIEPGHATVELALVEG